jgi:hypothetical protein
VIESVLRCVTAVLAPAVAVVMVIGACGTRDGGGLDRRESASSTNTQRKIRFDLADLNEDGLRGPPDGLRSLSYEFCIPAGDSFAERVRAIDPTVQVHSGSRGRVGCGDDQQLCIGDTHQSRFREVLLNLAALPYVDRIVEVAFEH